MKRLSILIVAALLITGKVMAQLPPVSPCKTDHVYRQFDFWIGEWNVYGLKGQKAGESKVDLILDSCIILENWTSSSAGYTGKSFNTYNAGTKQWQQTWVDNSGGTTEFLRGAAGESTITFWADNVIGPGGKAFHRRLTFFKLGNNKVRQWGERSDDDGKTWTTEYDLEYRRKM